MRTSPEKPSKTAGSAQRGRGITPFGQALKSFLRDSGLGPKLASHEVFAAWEAACGPSLAGRARAARFSDGVLLVEVQSAPHLAELKSFAGEQLRSTANQRLGSDRIRQVTFQLKR